MTIIIAIITIIAVLIFLLRLVKPGCKQGIGNEKIHSWVTSESQYGKRLGNEKQQ